MSDSDTKITKEFNDLRITPETKHIWKNLKPIEMAVHINEDLVEKQELKTEDIGEVMRVHGLKFGIFKEARNILQTAAANGVLSVDNQEKMEAIKTQLKEAEFTAQRAWKFNEDENYHIWWTELPGCLCPIYDNAERAGIASSIVVAMCPWHGNHEHEVKI